MMNELTEYQGAFHPVTSFRDNFAPAHAKHTHRLFDSMVDQAGIDVDANEVLNLRINKVSEELAGRTSILNKLRAKRVLSIVGAALAGLSPFVTNAIVQNQGQYLLPIGWVLTIVGALGLTGLGAWAAVKLTDQIRPLRELVAADQAQKAEFIAQGTAELDPLSQTYHWNMLDPVVEQSVPGLKLDPYVPISRQNDLHQNFWLADPFGPDSSVVATQSGEFNSNPFVTLQTLNSVMGSKTYTGTLVITWVEMETYTDSQGRMRTRPVTRTQTLVAHVTKPFPTYHPDAVVIFGTEAAPELAFSRGPSKLSALEGKRAERKVNRTVKKLEKQARKTEEGNNFTVTANQDFDALFHAVDRNDEVQYRVLFTPAAQQQMVDLLRDKQVGPGDNFEFYKNGRLVTIRPHHLVGTDLVGIPSPPPGSSEQWNLAHQKTGFANRAGEQFRNQFYGLAPALAIPVLHEPRTSEPLPPSPYASEWEAEATANHHGANYRHPESVTEDIIKVSPVAGDLNRFNVTSHGFRGIDRVDFVPTLGGDGRIHAVPVPWVEYQPVIGTGTLTVLDAATNPDKTGTFRRGLVSTPN